MDNNKKAREGEVLMLLVKRSGKEGREVAESLGITPGYLSTLYKSEILRKVFKKRVIAYFGVDESVFNGDHLIGIPEPSMVAEPVGRYVKGKVEEMSAAEVLRYLEDKDKRFEAERVRHFQERDRLLKIIENLTK